MRLRLERRYLGPEYTIGSLFINGEYLCDTIEDKVRDHNQDGDLDDPGEKKVFGETAIPYGRYKVDLTMSPKFKRLLPIILNVPHFEGIRIHRGNTAKDSHGCPLVGENKAKGKVLNSTKYELIVVERMLSAIRNQEEITIDVTKKS
jgi:hypothetical protein